MLVVETALLTKVLFLYLGLKVEPGQQIAFSQWILLFFGLVGSAASEIFSQRVLVLFGSWISITLLILFFFVCLFNT